MGNDPLRFVSRPSVSGCRLEALLVDNRLDDEPPALLLEVDSIDSLTMGVKISAPLEERRRKTFFGFRRFPLTLVRLSTLESHGIEPRRW